MSKKLTKLLFLLFLLFPTISLAQNQSEIFQSFQGIALKTISKSETIYSRSNKHEFHGVREFKNLFGVGKRKFNVKFVYVDNKNTVEDLGKMSWYFIQPKSAHGKKQYFLYYSNNKVIKETYEGDLLFIGKIDEENLLVLIVKKDSKRVGELLGLLDIEENKLNAPNKEKLEDIIARNLNYNKEIQTNAIRTSKFRYRTQEKRTLTKNKDISSPNLKPVDDLKIYQNLTTQKLVIVGKVTKIKDGDTIKISDLFTVRLYGIDTPEKKQLCVNKRGREYNCGIKSREYLKKLIGRRKVSCVNHGNGKYGRFLFECTNGQGININERMVESGWAVAEYKEEYKENEKMARNNKMGIWAGEFERPKDWRKSN
jgi:endonuclease YncB( thermonuclease family)